MELLLSKLDCLFLSQSLTMKRITISLLFLLLITGYGCERSSDLFIVSIHNDREDTIYIEKHFASNGAVHEIPVMPKQSQFMFQKEGDWEGVATENRLRYDSLIIVVDSLRIFMSRDSTSYFHPNPFLFDDGWETVLTSDEDDEPMHSYFLTIPEDSILYSY